MRINILKGKIHRVRVTDANLNYVGSITIDYELMQAAGIVPYEKVQVVDINNGNRLGTYAIQGERGKGQICLNGAAARYVQVGDRVIIMAYCIISEEEAHTHKLKVVFVNDDNLINKTNIGTYIDLCESNL